MSCSPQILCAANEATYALIVQALPADAACQQVTTLTALQAALLQTWDAIIVTATDATGAIEVAIDPLHALHLVRALSNVPFFVVANHLSATVAVKLIKAGADDYLEIDQLAQLPVKIAQVHRLTAIDWCQAVDTLWQQTQQQDLDRLKDEFISTISHELRTPIAALHGAIELLLSNKLGDLNERGQRLLHLAARNSDRLVRLTNDVFDLERLALGQIELLPQVCQIADLIEQAAIAIEPAAAQANINLQLHIQPAQIFADPQRITQVLTNLLSNVIKFSAAGDTIWLMVELRSNLADSTAIPASTSVASYVVIQVKDKGLGIPTDRLEAMLQRSGQADASAPRPQLRAELGLTLCRSIVRRHQGYLWVDSEIGQGSTFSFCLGLPIAAAFLPQTGNTEGNRGVKNLLEVVRGS